MKMNSNQIWEEDTYTELKEDLLKENRKYWSKSLNITQGEQWIYVYHGMSSFEFDWAVRENIVAKGLQKKTRLPIVSIIDGFGRALPEGFDESFGIVDGGHLFYSRYVDEASERTSAETARALAEETYQDVDKMLRMEYRGIRFGDELYDQLIAKRHHEDAMSFDCFAAGKEQYAADIRNVLSMIDHAFRMFELRRPAWVITTEKIHLKRLFGDIARRFGAQELIILADWPEILVRIPTGPKHEKVLVNDCMQAVIEYDMKRAPITLEPKEDLFAIRSETQGDMGDLRAQLGISNHNKNVFILPHALVDAPRETFRLHFYHDYHEWLLKTLALVRSIPGVNWIIKDHPDTAMYCQADYIKKVFEENKTANMYWCPCDVSGTRIKEYADCVVSCSGEAALEYWAYGIPTITTAETYFTGQGVSYNIRTEEDYAAALENIGTLEKPSESSARRAREILTAMRRMSGYKGADELVKLFISVRRVQLENYRHGKSYRHIPLFCEGYRRLLDTGALEESCIYQMKDVCEIS